MQSLLKQILLVSRQKTLEKNSFKLKTIIILNYLMNVAEREWTFVQKILFNLRFLFDIRFTSSRQLKTQKKLFKDTS